jgi:ribonuclease Z
MDVILTGTGFPTVDPRRAGPGTMVRDGDVCLQFDAGRATTQRLVEAGCPPAELTALFITHHHYDHLLDVQDLLLSRWMSSGMGIHPLPVIAPIGPSQDFINRVLDIWAEDIAGRNRQLGTVGGPGTELVAFEASDVLTEVWRGGDLRVSAILVDHFPVVPAVAYRVDGPHGAVVISGDTAVCEAVETIATGARLLVHEVILDAVARANLGNPQVRYHANAVALGAMAARVQVPVLALTHLIPAPNTAEVQAAFREEIRRGGYRGQLVLGEDLATIRLDRQEVPQILTGP